MPLAKLEESRGEGVEEEEEEEEEEEDAVGAVGVGVRDAATDGSPLIGVVMLMLDG